MNANLAFLVIAHGSRRAEANRELDQVCSQLRERKSIPIVQPAFLELTGPTIAEGGQRCVQQGAKEVLMLPYFLSPGIHVREDLIDHRDRLSKEFPGVKFYLTDPLGGHPMLIDILLQRVDECLKQKQN